MNNPRGTRPIPSYALNPETVPEHTPDENPIPICTKPITKEEYLAFMEQLRTEQEFERLPMAAWAYEEFPEFAETPEQLAAINARWTEETMKAKEKGDLEAEQKALEERIKRLKKMAKKNKAIRKAKARILEIEARRAELEDDEDPEIKINE